MRHVKHAAVILGTLAALALLPGVSAARTHVSPWVCTWHHFRRGDVTHYVQTCRPRFHVRHRGVPRKWTTAGPGDYPPPTIG